MFTDPQIWIGGSICLLGFVYWKHGRDPLYLLAMLIIVLRAAMMQALLSARIFATHYSSEFKGTLLRCRCELAPTDVFITPKPRPKAQDPLTAHYLAVFRESTDGQ